MGFRPDLDWGSRLLAWEMKLEADAWVWLGLVSWGRLWDNNGGGFGVGPASEYRRAP